MSEEAPAKKAEEGSPAWVMTFADLMSLLMCFFVLLLSFSEMDVAKYKQLAGSLKFAFGVQREIKAKEPPKGINVIAQEFSPGRPQPTPINVIRQMTTNDTRVNLELGKKRRPPEPASEEKREKGLNPGDQTSGLSESQKQELEKAKKLAAIRLDQQLNAEEKLSRLQAQRKQGVMVDEKSIEELVKAKVAAERRKKLQRNARLISSALGSEIKDGSIDVETEGQKIIIRVREKASFASGRASLKESFRPILARIAKILKNAKGKIIVAGHTDNIPIYTERFRSNWDLSSARAVSVAHEMMLATNIPSNRFLIQGYADTQPMVKNNTAANRARNRRVEIILQQGDDQEAGDKLSVSENPLASSPVQRQTAGRSTASKTSGEAARTASHVVKDVPVAKDFASKPTSHMGIKAGGH